MLGFSRLVPEDEGGIPDKYRGPVTDRQEFAKMLKNLMKPDADCARCGTPVREDCNICGSCADDLRLEAEYEAMEEAARGDGGEPTTDLF